MNNKSRTVAAAAIAATLAGGAFLLDRRRPSDPPAAACDADDIKRSTDYSKFSGYGYLASRCDLIAAWKKDGANIDIVQWLADHGYDSPAVDCPVTVKIDRRVKVGDKVLVWRRADGFLDSAIRLANFEKLLPGTTPGTVTSMTASEWIISSYGNAITIPVDERSSLLDRPGWNVLATTFHGERYEAEIPLNDEQVEAHFALPCWSDIRRAEFDLVARTDQPVVVR